MQQTAVVGVVERLVDHRYLRPMPRPSPRFKVHKRHPDLVGRDFTATAPNQLWVTDLTFVATFAGVAYVCFIIDAYSRMIVGWRAASHMRTAMVLDALEMARWSRGGAPGFGRVVRTRLLRRTPSVSCARISRTT
jgi:transposase InsO family protein